MRNGRGKQKIRLVSVEALGPVRGARGARTEVEVELADNMGGLLRRHKLRALVFRSQQLDRMIGSTPRVLYFRGAEPYSRER